MLSVVVGMAALAIDGSRAYALRRDLQAAVDAAALAAGDSAISLSGTGTLSVTGDVVSSGMITLSVAGLRVAGDIYARCQPAVSGSVTNACYPSGASAPCSYPDVAGATRSGYHFIDPGYPPPAVVGGAQGAPSATVVLLSGVYAAILGFGGGHCWFLSGGVYDWQAGFSNSADFISNELKPPDEPSVANNAVRATQQFWSTNGVQCDGAFQVTKLTGPPDLPTRN